MLNLLVDRFRDLVDDCKTNFRETIFKEWKLVVQEIFRFTKVDMPSINFRPLRYCAIFDSHAASLPYDHSSASIDHSWISGVIDINFVADMTDPTLPPNPRKAVLYHPSVTHLLAAIATICEELPPESIKLLYLSASGKAGHSNATQVEYSGGSRKSSNNKNVSWISQKQNNFTPEYHINGKRESSDYYENYLWLGPQGNWGPNNLYPGDILPFTRRPLFLIIASDNSHAFKIIQVAEKGETAALLLSPLRPAFKDPSEC